MSFEERNHWMELLRGDARSFNEAQDQLSELVRLDGVNLCGIDLRGKHLGKFFLDGAMFDSEEQFDIALRWGAMVENPRFDGGPDKPPTNRAPSTHISNPQPRASLNPGITRQAA